MFSVSTSLMAPMKTKNESLSNIREHQYQRTLQHSHPWRLQGPKLRVGEMENGGLDVVAGDILTFTNEKVVGNKERIYVSYPNLAQRCKGGKQDHD